MPLLVNPKVIQVVYEFSAQLGRSPTWFEPQRSFTELVEHQGSYVRLLIRRQDDFIHYRVPFFELDSAASNLSCIHRFLLRLNNEDDFVSYALSQQHNRIDLRCAMPVIAGDIEQNIELYLQVRDAIIRKLDNFDDFLQALSEECLD
jgi:hypothetical protein